MFDYDYNNIDKHYYHFFKNIFKNNDKANEFKHVFQLFMKKTFTPTLLEKYPDMEQLYADVRDFIVYKTKSKKDAIAIGTLFLINLMDSYKKELDEKLFPHIEKLIEENQLAFALQHMSKSYYIHSKEVVVNNMKKGYFEGKRVSMTNLNNADYLAIYTNDKRLVSYFTTEEIMKFASKRTIAEYIFIYLIDYPIYSLREEYFKEDTDNVKKEIKELTDSFKIINENFINFIKELK